MSSHHVAEQPMTEPTDLENRCGLLRSLHVPGTPLVLPNAWDVASARATAAAGFPVVATTSAGVAASLGYEDHERAPGDESSLPPRGSPQASTSRLPSTPRPAMGWSPPIWWPD
jgi:hypothetical protein